MPGPLAAPYDLGARYIKTTKVGSTLPLRRSTCENYVDVFEALNDGAPVRDREAGRLDTLEFRASLFRVYLLKLRTSTKLLSSFLPQPSIFT